MRFITKYLALSCCLILLGATAAMAFGEIRYPDRPLNLRKARSPKTAWVGSLYPGQKVRIGFPKNGWVAVFEPGETRNSESAAVGYSNVKYLKKTQTRVEPKPWGELVSAVRNLNVRNKPSRQGRKVGMLAGDQHVRIDFPEDDWIMVFSPKATIRSMMNAIGYSSAKYFEPVTAASMAQAAPPVVKEAAPKPVASGEWGNLVTITRKINLREGRTTGSKYIRTLKPGEKVRLDFLKSGWIAVFLPNEPMRNEGNAMGYALKSLVDDGSEAIVATSVKKMVAPEPQPVAVSTPAPKPVASTAKAAPVATAKPKKASLKQKSVAPLGGSKKTMVINKSQFKATKRPDPTPNKTAHGYQYRLLEKSETKKFGETWITLKVFLSTTKLPGVIALRDFSTSLWKEHKKATKNLVVLIYLPGMDTEDLSYGVVQFDDEEALELWVRKATLFGTDFL